jgi:HD-like signal output (HDOD) protein/ActR/RegA family two-component response regulator
MTKRILFVDDEPLLLKGLERSLRGMRKEWEMEFVLGGPQALDAMGRRPFDVVISDMRMPGMDGAKLLELVKEHFSQTVRMVLSGQSDKDAVFRAIRPAHQYLSKPCEIEELKQKLKCALARRDVLDSPELKQKVSQVESIPSFPSLYQALRLEMCTARPSAQNAADIVSRDPGMTAKLLQVVNSAFLGSASRISPSKEAISVLGLDNLRSLVLSVGLFSELPSCFEILAPLWEHACKTARLAQAIARCENVSESMVQDCFTAALLHEIGWIILATSYGERFHELCTSLDRGVPTVGDERTAFGGTHAQVGAYLLGLWGLPDSIIEAVAWHHAPAQVRPAGFCPLVAVHVADNYDRQMHRSLPLNAGDGIDKDWLAQLGLGERLAVWRKRCEEIDGREEYYA